MSDLFGSKEYRCILIDPPWDERGGGKIKRGADRHYGLVGKLGDVEPIYRTVRGSGVFNPASNCHLFVWYTDNFLLDALDLVKRLGFVYKRTFVWFKTDDSGVDAAPDFFSPDELDEHLKMGIGQYGRGCHEGMIFATLGKGQDESVWVGDRSVKSAFHAPHPRGPDGKIIHSRKPPKSYALIERVSKGPRVELFARTRYNETWDVWGDQAPSSGEE